MFYARPITQLTLFNAVDLPLCAAAEEPRTSTSTPQSDKVTDGLRLLEVVDGYNFSAIEQRSRLTAGMPSLPTFSSSRAPRAALHFRSHVHDVSLSSLTDPEFLFTSPDADADLRDLQ